MVLNRFYRSPFLFLSSEIPTTQVFIHLIGLKRSGRLLEIFYDQLRYFKSFQVQIFFLLLSLAYCSAFYCVLHLIFFWRFLFCFTLKFLFSLYHTSLSLLHLSVVYFVYLWIFFSLLTWLLWILFGILSILLSLEPGTKIILCLWTHDITQLFHTYCICIWCLCI